MPQNGIYCIILLAGEFKRITRLGRLLLHSPKTGKCKLSIKEMTSILFQRAIWRTILSILKNPFLQESQELVCLLAFVQLIFHHIVLPLIKDFFTFLKKPTMVMAILSKNWNKSPMHKVYKKAPSRARFAMLGRL